MPRSLTGRIVLVVVLPILAAWLAMGLTLAVILGNLHADATKSSLGDIGQTLVARFRNAVLDRDLRSLVGEVKDAVADTDISVQVLRADGTYVDLGTAGGPAVPTGTISIPASAPRGATITGSAPFTDGQSHLYAATILRQVGVAGPRAIVLSVPDRSRAAAIADLVRTLPVVVLVSAIVGLPLVLLLSRSVGAPLRRLADATADLPVRSGHDPLPLEGPSEVRELTARFNAMAGELTDARQRETELLADLRHDLRTPLTVIGGYAAALADGTAAGPDAERAARTIGEEAARLGRLVDELGAVERLRQGVDGLRPEPLDAAEVLRETAVRFESAAQASGIELRVIGHEPPAAAFPSEATRLRGRPGRRRADHGQPGQQRSCRHADGRTRLAVGDLPPGVRARCRRSDRAGRHRRRARVSARCGVAGLRTLLPRRPGTDRTGERSRPRHRPGAGRRARWNGPCRERGATRRTGQRRASDRAAGTLNRRPTRTSRSGATCAGGRLRLLTGARGIRSGGSAPKRAPVMHADGINAPPIRRVPTMVCRKSPRVRVVPFRHGGDAANDSAGSIDDRDLLPGAGSVAPAPAVRSAVPRAIPVATTATTTATPANSRMGDVPTRWADPVAAGGRSQNDESVGTPVGTIDGAQPQAGDQAADVGDVVDRTAGGETEREVDHDQNADLSDERPALTVDRVMQASGGEQHPEQPEDGAGRADRRHVAAEHEAARRARGRQDEIEEQEPYPAVPALDDRSGHTARTC